MISSAENLGGGGVGNSLELRDGGMLRTTGSFDLGVNRSVAVGGAGGVFDVVGSNRLGVSGAVSGTASGALLKTGLGTLVFSNSGNTFQDTLQVGQGRVVFATGSSFAGRVVVDSGAALSGEGTIGGSVAVAGQATLSPGTDGSGVSSTDNGIGRLATGSVTLAADSTFLFEFSHSYLTGAGAQANAGTQWDLLDIAGTLKLDGIVNLKLGDVINTFDPLTGSLTDPVHWLFVRTTGGFLDAAGNSIMDSTQLNALFQIDSTALPALSSAGQFYVTAHQ
ncbi:MAG: hypothetical protein QM775_30830 [Pirellulales bacterium]